MARLRRTRLRAGVDRPMEVRSGIQPWLRLGGAGLLFILFCACSLRSRQPPAQGSPTIDEDVFAALLSTISTDPVPRGSTRAKLYVDPRPIAENATVLSVDQQAFLPVSSAILERRLSIIKRIGLDSGDASFPKGCPGVMTPRAPSSPPPPQCPRTARYVAAIGLARAGDSDSATATDAPDLSRRSVRVVLTGIGPAGISAEVRDYVLASLAGKWIVARMNVRGFVE